MPKMADINNTDEPHTSLPPFPACQIRCGVATLERVVARHLGTAMPCREIGSSVVLRLDRPFGFALSSLSAPKPSRRRYGHVARCYCSRACPCAKAQ